MMLGLYAQIYAQFAMVDPMDEDEFDTESPARRSLKGVVMTSGLLIVGLILVPFVFGVVSGIKNPGQSEIAILSHQAKTTCEARGSSVHWVSIAKEYYGFACFDQNRPAPSELDPEGTEQ